MKKTMAVLAILALLLLCGTVLAAENAAPVQLQAWLAQETLTPDADISDAEWASPVRVSGGNITAELWARWQPERLYLALRYENAESMELSLGTGKWNFQLAETITGQGISGTASQGVAELSIDLGIAGVTVLDYNQTTPLTVELTNGDSSAEAEILLIFSGAWALRQPFTGTVYANATVSDDQQTLTLGSATGGYHVLQNIAAIDHSKDIFLRQRVSVIKLGKSAGTIPTASATGTGYYFTVSDYEGGAESPVLFANLFNNGQELILRFRCGESGSTAYRDVPLGKTEGSTFDLEVVWTAGDDALVYVDGVPAGTAEDVTYQNKSFGKNALSSRYAGAAAEIQVSQRVLTVVEKNSVLDNLTFSDISGGNPAANQIIRSLQLPETVTDSLLGTRELVWSSSDPAVIGNDGTVFPVKNDTPVVLTVSLKDLPTSAKTFSLTVPKMTMEAALAWTTAAVDGVLSESHWPDARLFSVAEGDVTGSVRAAWLKGKLYLGLTYENAASATVCLGQRQWTFPLSGAVSGEGITGITGDSGAELCIELSAAGIKLTDYGQMADLQITLTGENGSAQLFRQPLGLIFSGVRLQQQPFTGTTFSKVTVSDDQQMLTLGSATGGYHVVQNIAAIDHSKDISLRQRIQVVTMGASEGTIPAASATGTGYYFTISDYEGGTDSPVLFANLFNNGNELILRFRCGASGSTAYKDVPLGKTEGSTFDLEIIWTAGDDALVYVDGTLAGTAEDVTYQNKSFGKNALSSRYAGAAAEIRVSQRTLAVAEYTSVSQELTREVLLPGVDLLRLTGDLALPDTYSSPYLGVLELEWASSDESILTAAGKVQRPEGTLGRYGVLTLGLDGRTVWWEDIFVLPMNPYVGASPAIADAAFTAEKVTVDGVLDEEGWNLNTDLWWNDQNYGSFGFQWDSANLYFGASTGSNELSITLNGQTLDISGGKTADGSFEIAVALQDLGITVTDYGVTIPARVTAGSGVWEGTVRLTSTDWYITDSTDGRTTATGATVNMGGGPVAAGYQSAEQTGQGWHFYDLYAPDGSAGDYVRTYRIFTLPQLADRAKATWMEWNMLVESMPAYVLSSSTNWSGSYASYGLCWSLSDQRVDGQTNTVMMGILNTENGLCFTVKQHGITLTQPLNRYVGQRFRIATCWETDGSLTLWIDGQRIKNFENVTHTMAGMGSTNLILNLIRNRHGAESKNDDISVHVEDLSLGYRLGDQLLDSLNFDTIAGTNADPGSITADLTLPDMLTNSQLTAGVPLTWSSSHPDVISDTGAVTVPLYSTVVQLTAVTGSGQSKTFTLCVKGSQTDESVLVVRQDWNPAKGAGTPEDVYPFLLDDNNNSLIRDLGISQTVNVVKLTDSDGYNRLNESVLTLWVSDDNVTYSRVESFKLLRTGKDLYLYDFIARGRYVKVHCTHYQSTEADFLGLPREMIQAGYEEIFGANGGSFTARTLTVTNPNADSYDGIWTLEGQYQRVLLDGKLLYHYVSDGNTYVRVPYIAKGQTLTLTVLMGNAAALDISNREAVHEVVYGTREARVISGSGRWITALPGGSLLSIDGVDVKDGNTVLYRYLTWSRSHDGGMTWTDPVAIVCEEGEYDVSGGGVTYDPNTGRIIVVSFHSEPPESTLQFLYSDDLGNTWHLCEEVAISGNPADYALTYTPPTVLSCHDGLGENVDMVVPVAVIFNEEGSFCVRVVYSADGGLTWTMGSDEINYTGQGLYENESGTSEGTILEREDGTLVLYARCQYDSVNYFAVATSSDHGLSWSEASLSSIYTVNTQPMAYRFGEIPLLVWGGNNAMGGNSYMRFPMSIGVFAEDLMSVTHIQDLYSRYSLQGMNRETMNKITNPSVAHSGESLTVSWWANTGRLIMRVDDLTDYLYRTKGAWDSFESTDPKYEGWSATAGDIRVSTDFASQGSRSMELTENSGAVRSIPYLQSGTVSFDLYIDSTDVCMTIELESAYSDTFGKAAPIALRVENGMLAGVKLKEKEWNRLVFDLELSGEVPLATLTVNGQCVELTVNAQAGNYICYVDITAVSLCRLDAFQVTDLDPLTIPEESQPALPKISGNLSLNETIDINFIIPAVVDMTDAVLVVKNAATGEDVEYTILPGIGGTTVVRYRARANHMTDEITVQVFDAEGNALTQKASMSVRKYAGIRFAVAEETEKMMLIRMLDYGALAQINSGVTTDLANSIVTDDLRSFANAYDWADAVALEVPAGSGGVFKAGLALNETIDVTVYTAATNVADGDKFVVKCNGEELAEDQYIVRLLDDGRYVIRYSVKSNEMSDEIYIAIVGEDNTVKAETTLGVRIYAQKFLAAVPTGNQAAMLLAMLDYGTLAQIYAGSTENLANCFVSDTLRQALISYAWPAN